jgi:ethanolamine utilization protein EutP
MDKTVFMLVGPIEAGKSTLFKAIFNREEEVRKTQAMEFEAGGIDTPGELFCHPRLYYALINTSGDVDTIVYVHPGDLFEFRLPSGLLEVYEKKKLLGVITKTDLPEADPDRIAAMLRENGFRGPVFRVSCHDPQSMELLKNYLLGDVPAPDVRVRSAIL